MSQAELAQPVDAAELENVLNAECPCDNVLTLISGDKIPCPDPAEWKIIFSCNCGYTRHALQCDRCKKALCENNFPFTCAHCCEPVTFSSLKRIHPV